MNEAIILQRGEALSTHVAKPVSNIGHSQINELIDTLKSTVAKANGVGIAAPQIGEQVRLFIMCPKPSERYPNAPELEPEIIINPEILTRSKETELGWEGCLSVKGKRALVERHTSIEVSYFDENNEHHQKVLNGFIARIFQHELDHLDGITFIERLTSESDAISEDEWRNNILNEQ